MAQSSNPTGNEENSISEEEIDETLEESFPASDPPQWALGLEPHAEPQEATDSDKEDELSE